MGRHTQALPTLSLQRGADSAQRITASRSRQGWATLDAQRAHDEVRYEPIAQARAEASREDREQQVALEQREVVADADPLASCKGMVGVP